MTSVDINYAKHIFIKYLNKEKTNRAFCRSKQKKMKNYSKTKNKKKYVFEQKAKEMAWFFFLHIFFSSSDKKQMLHIYNRHSWHSQLITDDQTHAENYTHFIVIQFSTSATSNRIVRLLCWTSLVFGRLPFSFC